jgi:hypothetical protein
MKQRPDSSKHTWRLRHPKGQVVGVDGPEYETITGCGSNLGIFDPQPVNANVEVEWEEGMTVSRLWNMTRTLEETSAAVSKGDLSLRSVQLRRLSDRQAQRLCVACLEILERSGVRLYDQEALDLLNKSGVSALDRYQAEACLCHSAICQNRSSRAQYEQGGGGEKETCRIPLRNA